MGVRFIFKVPVDSWRNRGVEGTRTIKLHGPVNRDINY